MLLTIYRLGLYFILLLFVVLEAASQSTAISSKILSSISSPTSPAKELLLEDSSIYETSPLLTSLLASFQSPPEHLSPNANFPFLLSSGSHPDVSAQADYIHILPYTLQPGNGARAFFTYFEGQVMCQNDCSNKMHVRLSATNFQSVISETLGDDYIPDIAVVVLYFFSVGPSARLFPAHQSTWKVGGSESQWIRPFSQSESFSVPAGHMCGFSGQIFFTLTKTSSLDSPSRSIAASSEFPDIAISMKLRLETWVLAPSLPDPQLTASRLVDLNVTGLSYFTSAIQGGKDGLHISAINILDTPSNLKSPLGGLESSAVIPSPTSSQQLTTSLNESNPWYTLQLRVMHIALATDVFRISFIGIQDLRRTDTLRMCYAQSASFKLMFYSTVGSNSFMVMLVPGFSVDTSLVTWCPEMDIIPGSYSPSSYAVFHLLDQPSLFDRMYVDTELVNSPHLLGSSSSSASSRSPPNYPSLSDNYELQKAEDNYLQRAFARQSLRILWHLAPSVVATWFVFLDHYVTSQHPAISHDQFLASIPRNKLLLSHLFSAHNSTESSSFLSSPLLTHELLSQGAILANSSTFFPLRLPAPFDYDADFVHSSNTHEILSNDGESSTDLSCFNLLHNNSPTSFPYNNETLSVYHKFCSSVSQLVYSADPKVPFEYQKPIFTLPQNPTQSLHTSDLANLGLVQRLISSIDEVLLDDQLSISQLLTSVISHPQLVRLRQSSLTLFSHLETIAATKATPHGPTFIRPLSYDSSSLSSSPTAPLRTDLVDFDSNSHSDNSINALFDQDPDFQVIGGSLGPIGSTAQLQHPFTDPIDIQPLVPWSITFQSPNETESLPHNDTDSPSAPQYATLICDFPIFFPQNASSTVTTAANHKFKVSIIGGTLLDKAYISLMNSRNQIVSHYITDQSYVGKEYDPYILYEPFSLIDIPHDLDRVYHLRVVAPVVNTSQSSEERHFIAGKALQCQLSYEMDTYVTTPTTLSTVSIANSSQPSSSTSSSSSTTSSSLGANIYTRTTFNSLTPTLDSTNIDIRSRLFVLPVKPSHWLDYWPSFSLHSIHLPLYSRIFSLKRFVPHATTNSSLSAILPSFLRDDENDSDSDIVSSDHAPSTITSHSATELSSFIFFSTSFVLPEMWRELRLIRFFVATGAYVFYSPTFHRTGSMPQCTINNDVSKPLQLIDANAASGTFSYLTFSLHILGDSQITVKCPDVYLRANALCNMGYGDNSTSLQSSVSENILSHYVTSYWNVITDKITMPFQSWNNLQDTSASRPPSLSAASATGVCSAAANAVPTSESDYMFPSMSNLLVVQGQQVDYHNTLHSYVHIIHFEHFFQRQDHTTLALVFIIVGSVSGVIILILCCRCCCRIQRTRKVRKRHKEYAEFQNPSRFSINNVASSSLFAPNTLSNSSALDSQHSATFFVQPSTGSGKRPNVDFFINDLTSSNFDSPRQDLPSPRFLSSPSHYKSSSAQSAYSPPQIPHSSSSSVAHKNAFHTDRLDDDN